VVARARRHGDGRSVDAPWSGDARAKRRRKRAKSLARWVAARVD